MERRNSRRILDSTPSDETKLPLIELSVIAGESTDSEQSFISNWTVESVDEHTITIKVVYENPIAISQNEEGETALITLRLDELKDIHGRPLTEETILSISLPRQIPSETQADSIKEAGEKTQVASFLVIVLNFLLAFSLNAVWGMLNGI